MNLLRQGKEKEPEIAIEAFLKRYYRQQDIDMKDLKATAQLKVESFFEEKEEKKEVKQYKVKEDPLASAINENKSIEGQGPVAVPIKVLDGQLEYSDEQINAMCQQLSYGHREAKARLLNERLRRILASHTL